MCYGNKKIREQHKAILAGISFIREKDRQGNSRRRYNRICLGCGKEEWVLPQAICKGRKYCNSCAKERYRPSTETKEKISKTLRAKYTSPSYKEMVLGAQNCQKGEKHYNWKGGVKPINQKERCSKEYNDWRKKVFERDLYHCRLCRENSDTLVAHHIIPWSVDKSKRYELNNGITLCKDCHRIIHLYLKEINKQLNEFLNEK